MSETIAEGAGNVESVTGRCGAGGDCGACHDDIRQLLGLSPRSRLEVAA